MLSAFLNNKPLYYETIDYSRMPRVYNTIKSQLKVPKIIHIIGTNGKGTTGRFLACALLDMGYSVGHYTSPHILKFNERIWLNGKDINDEMLNAAHSDLLRLLSKEDAESLSYFEYATFLAMCVYQDFNFVILEAGLGGEYDATSVFFNELTLVTPIDIDHEAFLGDTINKIASTKLNAIQKIAILAKQPHEEVYEIANSLKNEKSVQIYRNDEFMDEVDKLKIELISKNNNLADYLQENLKLSIAALKILALSYEVDNFNDSKLFGRLSVLNENILLDVGHNALAARAIYDSLKEFKYTLVYNSYKDKHYKEILTILKPIIADVEIMEIVDERIEPIILMEETLKNLGISYSRFVGIEDTKKYLVFGSFSVVEAFLKVYSG